MAEILQSKLVDHNGVYLAVNETAFPRWRNSCTSSRTKETKLPRRVPITMTSGQKEAIFRQAAANFWQKNTSAQKYNVGYLSVNSSAPELTARVQPKGRVKVKDRVRVEVMVKVRVRVKG